MVSRQPQPRHLQSGQLQQRNTRVFIFLLIGFCLFFFLRYTNRLIEYSQELYNVEQWENKVEQSRLEQAELLAFRAHVQTDAYVEEISRQQLLMARPGDTLVVILPEEQNDPSRENVVSGDILNNGTVDVGGSAETVGSASQAGIVDNTSLAGTTMDGALGSTVATDPHNSNGSNVVSVIAPTDTASRFPSSIQDEPSWRQWFFLFSQSSE